jgi:hypothetical protein
VVVGKGATALAGVVEVGGGGGGGDDDGGQLEVDEAGPLWPLWPLWPW